MYMYVYSYIYIFFSLNRLTGVFTLHSKIILTHANIKGCSVRGTCVNLCVKF